MFLKNSFKNQLFDITERNFNDKALQLFLYQSERISIYKSYINSLKIDTKKIAHYSQIPFLPISFFKYHKILDPGEAPKALFKSSGTTGISRSHHYVSDPEFYKKVSRKIFELNFGPLDTYNIAAFLPSYQENKQSSLIYMIDYFLSLTEGTYITTPTEFINFFQNSTKKTNLLFGVTYALLDLTTDINLSQSIVIETGGMKGRGKELSREQVHEILKARFRMEDIGAEYGMTELLSQAYSKKEGLFQTPSWMKFLLREINDPFTLNESLKSGGLNIIDLANVDSCAFIMTEDIASKSGEHFKILGRLDNSDARGCNLMYVAE